MDGTGWSRKTAWTERTGPTAPRRTAAASSSYVRSVRLHGHRPNGRAGGGKVSGPSTSSFDRLVEGVGLIHGRPFVIHVVPRHGHIPNYYTRSGNHGSRRISADVLRLHNAHSNIPSDFV